MYDELPAALLSIAAVAMVIAAVVGGTDLNTTLAATPSGPVLLGEAVVCLVGFALVGRVAFAETWLGGTAEVEFDRRDVERVAAVSVAAVTTRVLAVEAGLGAVVAAALVGLFAGAASRCDVAAYCGAFVGMAGPGLFPDRVAVLVAGVVAGLLLIASDGLFDGVGGKLGTVAFLGCGAVVLPSGAVYPAGEPLAATPALAAVLAGAAGAGATYVLGVERGAGPVVGSAVVGLLAGLLAPPLLGAVGDTFAAAAFCASFVGMSAPDRLGGGAVVLAGTLAGLLFVGASPWFVASGGKLGTIAFTACLLVDGASRVGDGLPVEVPTPS